MIRVRVPASLIPDWSNGKTLDPGSRDHGSIPWSGAIAGWTGVVPARSHKPYDAGSNPASATKGGRDKVSRDLCKVLAAGSIPALSMLEA